MPKTKKFFKNAQDVATGTAGLGITTAVGAGIIAQSPTAAPLGYSFTTLSGFVPIATTTIMGKSVLDLTRNLQPKRRSKYRY